MNSTNGAQDRRIQSSRRRRIPTADEALQYSPFTSLTPFDSAVVKAPNVFTAGHSVNLLSPAEEDQARYTINSLDFGASTGTDAPWIQQTRQELQDLLESTDITEYKFRTPSLVDTQTEVNGYPTSSSRSGPRRTDSRLGSFANMVLQSTHVAHRYPTPISPHKHEVPEQRTPKKDDEPDGVPQHAARGSHWDDKNGRNKPSKASMKTASRQDHTPVKQQMPGTPTSQPDGHSRRTPVTHTSSIVIPLMPNSFDLSQYHNAVETGPTSEESKPSVIVAGLAAGIDRSQYQSDHDLDASIIEERTPSKKRKRDDAVDNYGFDIEQREQADAAVQALQEMMMNIFEAEDHLEPDTSGNVSDSAQRYFIFATFEESSSPSLNPEMLTNVENALTKVINFQRTRDIPVEQLSHLQKICSASLHAANGLDIALPEDLSDDVIEQWTSKLRIVDNSLRASKILLKTMCASSDEALLHSEDILKDIFDNLRHILETCLIPLVEKRGSSDESEFLRSRADERAVLLGLVQRTGRVMKLVGDLMLKVELSESSVTSIEFQTIKLLFVENATTDKDSLLGVQKFEIVRRHAMDVVAKIFFRYPAQRSFVFDEVLSSLEKLPVTRQSARQYKIADGKPIQLVSALIMQLLQTSTIKDLSDKSNSKPSDEVADGDESDSQSSVDRGLSSKDNSHPLAKEHNDASHESPIDLLKDLSKTPFDSAQNSAAYVAKYLIQRALTSTKTGDQPYRNLLDIFAEDFLSVLNSTEWPASELLLRALLSNLFNILDNDKSTAPAKVMCLDLLGTIGSGIADLRSHAERASKTLDTSTSELANILLPVIEDSLEGQTSETAAADLHGPHRVVIEHLQAQPSEDLQIRSATSYFIMQWARNVCISFDALTQDGEETDLLNEHTEKTYNSAARWLTEAIRQPDYIPSLKAFNHVSTGEMRLCQALVLLGSPLCKAFKRIFSTLLTFLSSGHATVRSRSLKSVIQLLEKDPSILDRSNNVMMHIFRCASDNSPLVRDSALGLIGKCISLKPAVEAEACKTLIARSSDAAVGVRKRAMKLLRDVYLRNKDKDLRAATAGTILQRLNDIEESVSQLARQTIEEMWLEPFYKYVVETSISAQGKVELQQHASLIVATAMRGEDVASVLEALFKESLSPATKNAPINEDVCKAVVTILFENIIDNGGGEGAPSQQESLYTLTIFAKADPNLFDTEQMIILRPYIENLSTNDDLLLYRSVIMIYRRVLPVLPPLQHTFLRGVQDVLFNTVSKLGKTELNEVSLCLHIIDEVLQNTERLVKLTLSVLRGINSSQKSDLKDEKELSRLKRYLMLAGYFGKACDFQNHIGHFKQAFPEWKGDSASGLMVDIMVPFTRRAVQLSVREMALESICLISQAWPKNYLNPQITSAFRIAFQDHEQRLEHVLLSGFKSFYLLEEERSKQVSEAATGDSVPDGGNRLGNSMILTDNDGAATALAQEFLPQILEIALSGVGELALLATEIIASTNRQGLVHPKESGPALVALETCPHQLIAKTAFEEHRHLHHKHESMLEKEYVKAVEQAFSYQKDVVRNVSGVDAGTAPKLRSFYEVLKGGSIGLRKKLLANLCTRVNLDISKKTPEKDLEARVSFARFVLENLSLFEYGRIDELLHLIACIEKIFSASGNSVSQRIESLLNLQMEPSRSDEPSMFPQSMLFYPAIAPPTTNAVDPAELRSLAGASMILAIMWETRSYLRRAWGLQSVRASKKQAIKDVNKAPTKSSSVSAEAHLEKIAEISNGLQSEEKAIEQCKAFVELLSVDSELRVGSDDEGNENTRFETPSDDAMSASAGRGSMPPPSGASKSGKRKNSLSATSTPSKTPKKRGFPSLDGRRRSSKMSMDDDYDDRGGWD